MATQELQYRIGFAAETRILRQIEADLQRQILLAKHTGKSYADLAAQLASVQGCLDHMGVMQRGFGELLGLASRIPGVGRNNSRSRLSMPCWPRTVCLLRTTRQTSCVG